MLNIFRKAMARLQGRFDFSAPKSGAASPAAAHPPKHARKRKRRR